MTSATTFPIQSIAQGSQEAAPACECSNEDHEMNFAFRGIIFGVPTGLALWFGLLKVATVLLRHALQS